MVKKRIIGVVTVKNDWVVQSFGYQKYLPIGRPECVIENLDRWGADEILVQVIDRSIHSLGPDFELLRKIGKLSLSTPLIYGGGIRDIADAVNVIKHGADRLVIDSLLKRNGGSVSGLATSLGSQAIIASLPVHAKEGSLLSYDYATKKSQSIDNGTLDIICDKRTISEVLLINKEGEGYPGTFQLELLNLFPKTDISFIAFGGISNQYQITALLNQENVSAVAIGNFLNYTEHAIQNIKKISCANNVRNPEYHSNL